MPQIEWRDPPERQHIRGKWIEVLTPVMERPGTWAMFYRHPTPRRAHAMASDLKKGNLQRPPGKWDFTGDQTTGEVFARYIGPE